MEQGTKVGTDPVIARQLTKLGEAIDALEKSIGNANVRMNPVLKPQLIADEKIKDLAERQTAVLISPIACAITDITLRLNELRQSLDDIISRAEC